MLKITDKKALAKLLGSISKEFEIIGPVKSVNRGVFYQPVINMDDLYLGNEFTVEPVKRFFLAPSEWFFKNKFVDKKTSLEEIQPQKTRRIIIGVRPCEARGLELLDKVFNSEYKDKSYISNRDRSVIVGLACSSPDKSCFCIPMGGTPVETRGMDAFLSEAGDNDELILEILTDKGQEIFGSLGKDLSEGREESWKSEKEKIKGSVRKIKIPETLSGCFEDNYWEEISKPCVSCGVCTYLCPTCHCFDLSDEEQMRLRCYDGCSFRDFTRQASGENPRPAKKERYRQRVFHKFEYFKKNFGENLCVGCGRCIRHCPVKMDISEIAANAPSKR